MAFVENTCTAHSARSTVSLRHIYSVWRSRRALAALDAAALNDIGLSYKDAQTEAKRPLWDVPQSWRA